MKFFFLNLNRGYLYFLNCFILSFNICLGNDEMKNVEVEKKCFKILFRFFIFLLLVFCDEE